MDNMKNTKNVKKTLLFVLAWVFCLCAVWPLLHLPALAVQSAARDITKNCTITLNGGAISAMLTDNDESTYQKYQTATISVKSSEAIGGVYIRFDRTPPVWTLKYGENAQIECGKHGFLHEYQRIDGENVTSITLAFDKTVSFADIFVLSRGEKLPSFVQVWRPAEGYCDIMLLTCHSDDDQLFFAGSVPDAVARGAEMQVCFFTNHWNRHDRPHELLNGLWTCGLDRYPVIGPFTDTKKALTEAEGLKIFEELGFTYDDMIKHQTELLRRFKPQIVLAHDIEGEYGHSAHRLDSHSLRDAALLSNDAAKYPESAQRYGLWDVPKIYLHLYNENKIDFEIDVPLDYFGGKTAYQVSQDAFRCHLSQFGTRYRQWLLGTEDKPVTDSSGFPDYSPRHYGLWRSLVGEDVRKTDFYENIVFYADQRQTDTPAPATDIPRTSFSPEETPTAAQTDAPSQYPTAAPTPNASQTPVGAATPAPQPQDAKKSGGFVKLLVGAAVLAVVGASALVIVRRFRR